jgi:oxygen-independent coproporphyrinogen-3 oxidase
MKPAILDEIPSHLVERYINAANGLADAAETAVGKNGAGSEEYARTLRDLGSRRGDTFALYVHLPFCPVRCHYCACNTNVTHDARKIDDYLDTLEREMDLAVECLGPGREVRQLHVGGGTPNYLDDWQLARLMEILGARFRRLEDGYACIECNPRRASAGQLELLSGLGFRRISFGVQDLAPSVQRAIGRVQSAEVVRDVCNTARQAGFENLSIDLVYGLPEQTLASFSATLEQIVAFGPDRIRCFSYAHAPSLRPHQFAIDAASLPTLVEKLTLFSRAVDILTDAGYAWVGVDCFARAGDEWSSAQAEHRLRRNGIGYTAMPADHLLAFGTYGLGEIGSLFVQNEPRLDAWQRSVRAGRLPVAWGHRLSDGDLRRRRAYEHLMCNLELPAGMAAGLDRDREGLERCVEEGLLELDSDGIRVTPRGRFFLRDLCVGRAASLDWDSAQWRYPKSF